MSRITQKDLERVATRLNKLAGYPLRPYIVVDGRSIPQANCYHIEYAYSGVQLVQMSSKPHDTSTRDVLGCGYLTKRDLYNRMLAFSNGLSTSLV